MVLLVVMPLFPANMEADMPLVPFAPCHHELLYRACPKVFVFINIKAYPAFLLSNPSNFNNIFVIVILSKDIYMHLLHGNLPPEWKPMDIDELVPVAENYLNEKPSSSSRKREYSDSDDDSD